MLQLSASNTCRVNLPVVVLVGVLWIALVALHHRACTLLLFACIILMRVGCSIVPLLVALFVAFLPHVDYLYLFTDDEVWLDGHHVGILIVYLIGAFWICTIILVDTLHILFVVALSRSLSLLGTMNWATWRPWALLFLLRWV